MNQITPTNEANEISIKKWTGSISNRRTGRCAVSTNGYQSFTAKNNRKLDCDCGFILFFFLCLLLIFDFKLLKLPLRLWQTMISFFDRFSDMFPSCFSFFFDTSLQQQQLEDSLSSSRQVDHSTRSCSFDSLEWKYLDLFLLLSNCQLLASLFLSWMLSAAFVEQLIVQVAPVSATPRILLDAFLEHVKARSLNNIRLLALSSSTWRSSFLSGFSASVLVLLFYLFCVCVCLLACSFLSLAYSFCGADWFLLSSFCLIHPSS